MASQEFLPLPVVDGEKLTYERFLKEFALPRVPCLIKNVGLDWKAAKVWSLDYFQKHPDISQSFEVECAEGPVSDQREVTTTVGEALSRIAATGRGDKPFYLNAFPYVRASSSGAETSTLQEDFVVPKYFERAPHWLNTHPVMGNAATDMKWLYIGSAKTASETHIDTNLSSAWLWVATGRKEWICAHGADYDLLTRGTGSRAYGYVDNKEEVDSMDDSASDSGSDSEGSNPLPDFFAPDLFERFPHTKRARLYHGFQEKGMICFNPSRCVHAVRNLSDLSISLTHNFIDATNFADALFDATRSIRIEMLPMAREFKKPKRMIRMLSSILKIKKEELILMLRDLPHLCCEEKLKEVVDVAANGDETIAGILRDHLHKELRDVRGNFVEQAQALKVALCLE